MATVKIIRKDTENPFTYLVDNTEVVKASYQGATLFLSALNAFIDYDDVNPTQWVYSRADAPQNNATSYLGLDGNRYTVPYPAFFYERIEGDPVFNPMTGLSTPSYTYPSITQLYLSEPSSFSDNDVYVNDGMSQKITLAEWKIPRIFTGSTTINDGDITGLKESITGFLLPISRLNLLLSLSGEPQDTALPRDVALQIQLIKMHFDSRPDRTAGINSVGELSF
jgi:hypothetical protein